MRAYKFRLYPNKVQRKEIQTHLYFSKNLWNEGLELAKQFYQDYELFPTMQAYQEMSKDSGLHSQVSQDVFRRLNKAIYGMIARRKKGLKAGFPRFKNIDRMKSLTYPQSGFSLKEKTLKITPFGEINVKKHREVEGKIKTLTLKREGDRWFAILTSEASKPIPPKREGEKIGIDLGLITFATLSNGEKIKKPNHFKKYEDRLAEEQRKLSKKKKGSNKRRKAKIKVARIHSKIANTRKDWLHNTVNSLVNKYSIIALEDLSIQDISEEHGKGTADAGWRMFTNIISYKAESAGCEVVFVNPYHTSQDCSSCGATVPKEEHERAHDCPHCGLKIDRDYNAAINILHKATTAGIAGSNACEDGTIVSSMKREAMTSAQAKSG